MALLSVSEYAIRYNKDPGNIRRLLASGRMEGTKVGHQWVIEENTPYPDDNRISTGEYRNWRKHIEFNSNSELADTVRKMNKELRSIYGKYLKKIVLYGSYARGDQSVDSDVDIAIILERGHSKDMHNNMIECVAYYELMCNKVLSVIDVDYHKYEEWKNVVPFYKNIDSEGVVLWKSA